MSHLVSPSMLPPRYAFLLFTTTCHHLNVLVLSSPHASASFLANLFILMKPAHSLSSLMSSFHCRLAFQRFALMRRPLGHFVVQYAWILQCGALSYNVESCTTAADFAYSVRLRPMLW
jgi:hypothetical protein